MTGVIDIAAGCFAPQWHDSEAALRRAVLSRVADARCNLLIFPEYMALEAAMIGAPGSLPDDPLLWAERGADAHDLWVDIMRQAARDNGCFILAGSGPVRAEGRMVNRAVFVAPDGGTAHQDKMIATPWERKDMRIEGGQGLTLFDTGLGKIGVTICYDTEFPLFARSLAAAGAVMILAPTCTDTPAGHSRVQIGARARALENQCLVVHAPMVGTVQGCDPICENTGVSGFFAPPDLGQPPDGILALGHKDDRSWVRYGVDPAQILATRRSGDVETLSDWPRQGVPDLPVQIVALGK